MSAKPTWIPAATITITVAAYNNGATRYVRVNGPTGQASMVADPRAWSPMVSWAMDVVSGELGVALGQLDDAGAQPSAALPGADL